MILQQQNTGFIIISNTVNFKKKNICNKYTATLNEYFKTIKFIDNFLISCDLSMAEVMHTAKVSIFENVCTLYKTADSDKKNTIDYNQ